jgi:hypothetical protein
MLRRVDHVRTDFSKKRISFIIKLDKISEIGTTLSVTINGRGCEEIPSENIGYYKSYFVCWTPKYSAVNSLRSSCSSTR